MTRKVVVTSRAGWGNIGALLGSELHMENPNKLVIGLHVGIFMAIHSNLKTLTVVVTTPVITAAELAITLKRQLDLVDLLTGINTSLLQHSAVSLDT